MYIRLCWCAASSRSCSMAESFNVDFGTVTVVGVSPIPQDRTCVAGQSCAIDGILGSSLSSTDVWLVLDTCSSVRSVPGFPLAASNISTINQMTVVSWGEQPLSAAGGTYRLCWSMPGWALVHVGDLTLIGPPLIPGEMHCTSTQPCSIEGLFGTYMKPSDTYMVLDTCGEAWQLAQHFPEVGFASVVRASGNTVSWGPSPVTAPGGIYRLCWCAGGFTCSIAEDFRVDVGSLMMTGPTPLTQHRTCVSGQSCEVEKVYGHRLASRRVEGVSSIRLLGFGDGHDVKNFTLYSGDTVAGPWLKLGSFETYNGSGSSQEFSSFQQSSSPLWRLLFHATHGDLAPRIREIEFFGESRGERKWVRDGAWVVSTSPSLGALPADPAAVALADRDANTWWPDADNSTGDLTDSSPFFELEVVFNFGGGDNVMVLDTCGLQASQFSRPLDRFPDVHNLDNLRAYSAWGSTPVTAAGGEYRLCWCPMTASCTMPEHFLLDTGMLTMIGPTPLRQTTTCVSGQLCGIDIGGHSLGTTDAVILMDTCGVGFLQPLGSRYSTK